MQHFTENKTSHAANHASLQPVPMQAPAPVGSRHGVKVQHCPAPPSLTVSLPNPGEVFPRQANRQCLVTPCINVPPAPVPRPAPEILCNPDLSANPEHECLNPTGKLACPFQGCSGVFDFPYKLTQHCQLAHSRQRVFAYPIPDCGTRSPSRSHQQRHRPKHADEQPFACPVEGCPTLFKRGYSQAKHYARFHSSSAHGAGPFAGSGMNFKDRTRPGRQLLTNSSAHRPGPDPVPNPGESSAPARLLAQPPEADDNRQAGINSVATHPPAAVPDRKSIAYRDASSGRSAQTSLAPPVMQRTTNQPSPAQQDNQSGTGRCQPETHPAAPPQARQCQPSTTREMSVPSHSTPPALEETELWRRLSSTSQETTIACCRAPAPPHEETRLQERLSLTTHKLPVPSRRASPPAYEAAELLLWLASCPNPEQEPA